MKLQRYFIHLMTVEAPSNLQSKLHGGLVRRLRAERVVAQCEPRSSATGGRRLPAKAGARAVLRSQAIHLRCPAPDDEEVVGAFLRDSRFLIFSPNAYNSLGVATTQLYNTTWVYNHKRHGKFRLCNRSYEFRSKPKFPRTVTPEFLLFDLLNNLDLLAEDKGLLLARVRSRFADMDPKRLKKALADYGSVATRKLTRDWLRS
jgi:hypothetical protein